MAVVHATVMYDVKDFKVYPLTADTSASPTYGAAVDVPGIASVTMNPNFVTAELKGDASIIAKRGRVDKFTLSATYGKLSMDVLKVLYGGSVDEQTTVSSSYSLLGTNSLPYFKAAFVIEDTDAGSLHITLYKALVTGGGLLNPQTDQFGQPSMDLEAIPIAGSSNMFLNVMLFANTGVLLGG